jgi:hypothetical protein
MKGRLVFAALLCVALLWGAPASAVNAHLVGEGEAVAGSCTFAAAFSGSHVSGEFWVFEGSYESIQPSCGGIPAFACVGAWNPSSGGSVPCLSIPAGSFSLGPVVLGLNTAVPFTVPGGASGTATVLLV